MPNMRMPAAFTLALLLGLLQVGTARPRAQAGQQPGGAQPAGAEQPVDTQQEQPVFRGGINFVRVDVIVTDKKGQQVTDLKQSDFEVTEDNKPQSIEQFRLIRVDGNPKPGEPPPRQIRNVEDAEVELAKDDVRVFVIFFDDYHVRLGNSLSVKEPLSRFIREQIRPNDVVAVMYPLTPVNDLNFTRNPAALLSAIDNFKGRKFDYTPMNQFEEQYARYPTETVEQVRNDVVMTALRGLATRLGGLREGRKSIIYVSEGLQASLPPQMRRADATMPADPRLRGGMMGENSAREQTAEFFGQSDLYSRMREVYAAANRNNAAFYALDPRGLAVFEYDINEGAGFESDKRALQATTDTLRVLAEETDGRAIVNRNDLDGGLKQMVRDSSVYYLLGYNSSSAPTDGKFHDIGVRVKRPGLDVRARKGYWAYTVEDLTKAKTPTLEVAKPVQQALASIANSVQAAKYIRTWIGTERAAGGKTRVTLIWEPLPGGVSLIAANPRGDLVFRGRVPDAALASTASIAATPAAPVATAPQRLVFDAPPGNLELRLSVEAAGAGGVIDTELRTLIVPDLTTPDAALSTPRVFRARTARDFNALAADGLAVPLAGREFSRSERVLIRFDVYGNALPSAVLLNRAGQKMADLPVVAAVSGGTHQIDVGLGAIAAGEYLIEIAVKGGLGEVRELVPIRVVS